jgi:hypothetical protein
LPRSLSKLDLLKLARAGAQARVDELRREIARIYRAFPELKVRGGRTPALVAGEGKRRPGVRRWSAAQRKAAAIRMKKYWAAVRRPK